MHERLRYSKYCHFFELKDHIALFHSLNLNLVFLRKNTYLLLKLFVNSSVPSKISSNIRNGSDFNLLISKLKGQSFLVPAIYDEMAEISSLKKHYLASPTVGILYLMLTDVCNFSCSYCFIENPIPDNHTFSKMEKEIAKKAVDLFGECLRFNKLKPRRSYINLYGGEPLLNLDTLIYIVEYINERKQSGYLPVDVSINLTTNGSLITSDIAKLIKKYNIGVALSLDGTREDNDIYRKDKFGHGTYNRIVTGYNLLHEIGANIGISCTVGKHNIDNLSNTFLFLTDELSAKSIGFNLLIDSPKFPEITEEYVVKATDKIIECFEIAREKGIYEDSIMRKVKSFIDKQITIKNCGACGEQLVVAPNGQIGVCHAFWGTNKYFIGTVNDEPQKILMHPTFIEWHNRTPLSMSDCFYCEGLGLCGGGCPYNAYIERNSIWAIDKRFCVYIKKTLNWLIMDLYKKCNLNCD